MRYLIFSILILLSSNTIIAQDNCSGWGKGIDSIKTYRYYEEYQKLVETNNYKDAVYFWDFVFRKAPGATKNVYLDGIKIYKNIYLTDRDADNRKKCIQKILDIYDQRATCYTDDLPNILARKAIEFYKLEETDPRITANLFKNLVDRCQEKTPSFALVPYADLAAKLYIDKKISEEEKLGIEANLLKIAQGNIDAAEDKDNYYAALVNVKRTFKKAVSPNNNGMLADIDMSDCAKVTRTYKKNISNKPNDERLIMKAINELKNLNCKDASKYATTLLALQDKRMREKMDGNYIASKSGNTVANANFAFKNGDYEKSVELYNVAIDETTDSKKKAVYHFQIAKILYSKLDDKSTAKKQILQTLKYEPNNGHAYVLLGDIYIAAAGECFPTDPFDQKMVIYAAIDKWKKAAKVDNSVADKAADRIAKYKNYLPTKSELFLARSRFKGKTYKLGSWINEKVRVKN